MIPIYLMNFLFAVSTTIGMSFLPLLVTENLGMSLATLGLIEGSAEFVSNSLKFFTGNLFDRIKNKRLLFVIPSILAFLSKVLLLLPTTFTIVLSKITERISNGAFAAPRDALAGQDAEKSGLTLGLLSIAKTAGCIVGPLLVSGIVLSLGAIKDNISTIIIISCSLSVIAFCCSFLVSTTTNIERSCSETFDNDQLKKNLKSLSPLLFLISLFFFARFNDGMIMMSLKQNGFPEWFYISTISFFNIAMLLISPFIGKNIDKKNHSQMLLLTITALICFNLCFSAIKNISWILAILGLIFWGVQRTGAAITFSSLIFKHTPKKFYGTAIGIYSVLSGASIFLSSLIVGNLASDNFRNVFIFSGLISVLSLISAIFLIKKNKI